MYPNFKIAPHIDHDPSYITRYHMPLVTNEKCTMHILRSQYGVQIEEQAHMPASGHIYFTNVGFKHWAENRSDQARLHLIIDVYGQKELLDVIQPINT